MNEQTFSTKAAVVVLSAAMLAGSFSALADSTHIAGKFQMSYAKQETLPVPAAKGHVLMMSKAEGMNSSAKGDYMDGAQVVSREILRLFNGNGTHQGYVTMRKDGSEVVDRWSGEVTTTMRPNGTPKTTFEGTWEKLSGTGQYQGIEGTGTYKGYFTSKTNYVVEYDGYYHLP